MKKHKKIKILNYIKLETKGGVKLMSETRKLKWYEKVFKVLLKVVGIKYPNIEEKLDEIEKVIEE